MELLKGACNKAEQDAIVSEVTRLGITVLQATNEQSSLAITLLRDYHLSNSMDIADAINAAIAISTGTELLSSNKKHYSPIKGLKYREYCP